MGLTVSDLANIRLNWAFSSNKAILSGDLTTVFKTTAKTYELLKKRNMGGGNYELHVNMDSVFKFPDITTSAVVYIKHPCNCFD